jgi:hypothetical protein
LRIPAALKVELLANSEVMIEGDANSMEFLAFYVKAVEAVLAW